MRPQLIEAWGWLFVPFALCLLGCGHELSLRASDFNARNVRVVMMPAMVSLYGIEEDGDLTFDDQSSKQARIRVNGWLRFLATTHGFRLADLREVSETELPADAFYTWLERVTKHVIADNGRRSLSSWKLGDGRAFQSWIPALKADYVAFIAFRGTYETTARMEARSNAAISGAVAGGVLGAAATSLFLGPNGAKESTVNRAALVVIDMRRNEIVRVQTIGFEQLDNPEIQERLGKLVDALVQ